MTEHAEQETIFTKEDVFKKQECYVTIKDHKPDFPARIKNRLINPAKSNIGKASKKILDRVNTDIRTKTGARQWRSTQDVTSWFESLEEKKKLSFIKFDIVEFYPSISESTFKKALTLAKKHSTISPESLSSATVTNSGPRRMEEISM